MTVWNILNAKHVYEQTLDALVVGGGGAASQSGGSNYASGGGGGGVYDLKDITIRTSSPYLVKVGAGGVGIGYNVSPSKLGNPGDYSQFYIYYATGGWGGDYAIGGNSGTYGITTIGTIVSPSAGGGYQGGTQALANSQGYAIAGSVFAGGGAGAGQTAKNYYTTTSYAGGTFRYDDPGNGIVSTITGTSTYYGGGGGSQAGGAGSGGGGSGYLGNDGASGFGGGGGASDYYFNGASVAGSGGSGAVIIKQSIIYPVANTTGSVTITSNSTFRLYKWTTPGTYKINF
jgi:hypothetical protein